MSTASAHDASQSLASSRHRVGAIPQRTSSSVSQVAEGGSAATASAWQTIKATAVSFRERGFTVEPSWDRPSMPPQQMRAAATERVSRIKASLAALRAEDTEDMSVLQVALEKAQRQASVPPVDHQIKATEDFIGRAKKRLLQHDVVINEAQEALQKAESMKRAEVERLAEAEELLQRLRVQVPEVPQIPRSVTDLEQLVAQLQSERDGLVDQLKNQGSTRLVEMVHHLQSSDEATQLVLERSAKRRAVGEDIPTNQQDLACWRDGRHRHHQGVVPGALQGSSQDGVLPFHGFQHGLLKQVPPLPRTVWGWRGVRVGEASNPGPVQTRSTRRLAEPLQDTTQERVRVDVATTRKRRRRLRALPWSWDSDSDLDGPVTQVGSLRGLVQSHRWMHLRTKRFWSLPTVEGVFQEQTERQFLQIRESSQQDCCQSTSSQPVVPRPRVLRRWRGSSLSLGQRRMGTMRINCSSDSTGTCAHESAIHTTEWSRKSCRQFPPVWLEEILPGVQQWTFRTDSAR